MTTRCQVSADLLHESQLHCRHHDSNGVPPPSTELFLRHGRCACAQSAIHAPIRVVHSIDASSFLSSATMPSPAPIDTFHASDLR